MKTKVCSKCKKEKDISEFYKDKITKDRLRYWCKKCFRENNKEYRQKNKERIIKYRNNNQVKTWCRLTINQHRYKGYEVLFTQRELLLIAEQVKNCPICDNPLDREYGKGLNNNSPSLDRINNEKILTLDNIQIICHRCNRIKNDLTMKEFINYCKYIANNN